VSLLRLALAAAAAAAVPMSLHFNPVDMELDGHHIKGLTHPSNILHSAAALWKRRAGSLTSAVKTNWVERLFVLTETALFWYELGGFLVSQHGRIEFRHIRHVKAVEAGQPTRSAEELERLGPEHQLEVTLVTDFVLHIGGTDAELVGAWQVTLARAIERAALVLTSPSPPPPPLPAAPEPLRRLELTGVVAVGMLGKARSALTGSLKTGLEHAGFISHHDLAAKQHDGWSSRNVVLTENALYFYKPIQRKDAGDGADDAPAFGGFGSNLRSGDYIFGREVGRMPLGMADVHVEQGERRAARRGPPCVAGPPRVESPPRVAGPPRVESPPRVAGPPRVESPPLSLFGRGDRTAPRSPGARLRASFRLILS
jgi:hypothetical protein